MNKKLRYASLLLLIPIFVVVIAPAYNNIAFAEINSSTQILYSINVGKDRYLIHFNACFTEPIANPSIIIESELDTVEITSAKKIHENSCQSFESIIDTKYPQLVKISIVE